MEYFSYFLSNSLQLTINVENGNIVFNYASDSKLHFGNLAFVNSVGGGGVSSTATLLIVSSCKYLPVTTLSEH